MAFLWFCGAIPALLCSVPCHILTVPGLPQQAELCPKPFAAREGRGGGCGTTGCDAGAGESAGSVLIPQVSHRRPLLGCCHGNTVIFGVFQTGSKQRLKGRKTPSGGMHRRWDFPQHSKTCDYLNHHKPCKVSGLERWQGWRSAPCLLHSSSCTVRVLLPTALPAAEVPHAELWLFVTALLLVVSVLLCLSQSWVCAGLDGSGCYWQSNVDSHKEEQKGKSSDFAFCNVKIANCVISIKFCQAFKFWGPGYACKRCNGAEGPN